MGNPSFLIIGGTFKSGTSALFTYLGQVPGICASKVKETGFFVPAKYGEMTAGMESYLDFFSEAKAADSVYMEASPGYLSGGVSLLTTVQEFLPERPKMIFLLRDPSKRLISFYQMIRENNDVYMSKEVAERQLSLADYIDACIHYQGNNDFAQEARDFLFNGISDGMYAQHLATWFEHYPNEEVKVLFFEDLIDDPKKVCADVLDWLKMDPASLEKIVFRPVNQSHQARSKTLRKIAMKTNKRFQHFFRKNERFKRFLVKIYHLLNARKKSDSDPFAEARAQLEAIYREDKIRLLDLLKSKGYVHFPAWLEKAQ
jgi:hypothetical protein